MSELIIVRVDSIQSKGARMLPMRIDSEYKATKPFVVNRTPPRLNPEATALLTLYGATHALTIDEVGPYVTYYGYVSEGEQALSSIKTSYVHNDQLPKFNALAHFIDNTLTIQSDYVFLVDCENFLVAL